MPQVLESQAKLKIFSAKIPRYRREVGRRRYWSGAQSLILGPDHTLGHLRIRFVSRPSITEAISKSMIDARQVVSRGRLSRSLLFRFGLGRLSQPYAGATTIFVDELDASAFQRPANR